MIFQMISRIQDKFLLLSSLILFLFSPLSLAALLKLCESAFSVALRPKDPGPSSCSLVDWALIHRS